jgi:hypothetical protein
VKTNSPASGLSPEDARLIHSLQQQPSSLCQRCIRFNIVDAFSKSEPLDQVQRAEDEYVDPTLYINNMAPYRLVLGRPSSIHLEPLCQFCRLLYGILPRHLDPDELQIHIEPFRSHIRQEGWEIFPADLKDQCTVFLGLANTWSPFTPTSDPFRAGDGRACYLHGHRFCFV